MTVARACRVVMLFAPRSASGLGWIFRLTIVWMTSHPTPPTKQVAKVVFRLTVRRSLQADRKHLLPSMALRNAIVHSSMHSLTPTWSSTAAPDGPLRSLLREKGLLRESSIAARMVQRS